MGNCCSPATESSPADFVDTSPPHTVTAHNNVLHQQQEGSSSPSQPLPISSNTNSIDYRTLGQALDHISDREGMYL